MPYSFTTSQSPVLLQHYNDNHVSHQPPTRQPSTGRKSSLLRKQTNYPRHERESLVPLRRHIPHRRRKQPRSSPMPRPNLLYLRPQRIRRLLRAPPLQSPHTPPLPPQILLRRVPLRRDALRSQGQVQHREQQDGGYVCECKYQAECRVVD